MEGRLRFSKQNQKCFIGISFGTFQHLYVILVNHYLHICVAWQGAKDEVYWLKYRLLPGKKYPWKKVEVLVVGCANVLSQVQCAIYDMKADCSICWQGFSNHNTYRIISCHLNAIWMYLIWRLAHFFPSLSIIDIFVSSLHTTCFHWTSAHEMRSFVHCIHFCVCFLFSTGFFRGILLFWQTSVISLHSVLALTKTLVALNTLLFAACDIRIPPRKIYFIPISWTVVLFSASLFCIDGVSW